MQMTEAFASAVTVSVPIFALAAGAEARAIRERLRRPDQKWEQEFAAYRAEHELNLSGRPSEILGYFKGAPGLSRLYVMERLLAIASALVWLAVFVLLGVAELRGLVWLADGARPGDPGLATFSVVAVGTAMAALIVAPTLYFLVPLLLPFDVIPQGLKDTVLPGLNDKRGRGFVKLAFAELEGAMERAADKLENASRPPPGRTAPTASPVTGEGQPKPASEPASPRRRASRPAQKQRASRPAQNSERAAQPKTASEPASRKGQASRSAED
jgi:hypothetical protein